MAEVYGSIGDQPVELNNAASEATLKALLEVAKATHSSATKGKNAKAQKDLEKKLKDLAAAADQATRNYKSQSKNQQQSTQTSVQHTKAVSQATKATKEDAATKKQSIRATREQAEAAEKATKSNVSFRRSVENALGTMAQVASGIQNMGSSIRSATGLMSGLVKEIPLVGGIIGSAMDMVAEAIESTHKSFMEASAVGANFGGSINSMIHHATEAGLTIEQFTNIIGSNGEGIAQLGRSSAEGAKRLSGLAKTMKTSGLQDELAYLGYGLEDISGNLATFSNMLAKGGVNVRALGDQQLVELTAEYMKNLDAVSKLTGQSRKDLERQNQERQRDAKFRVLERRLDPSSRTRLQNLFNIIGPEFEKGAKDLMMGFANTPEAQAMLVFQGEAAREFQEMGRSMRATGQLTTASTNSVVQSLVRGAEKINKSELVNILGGPLAEKYGNFVVANMDIERLKGKSLEEIEKEIQKEIDQRKKIAEANDPAKTLETQQSLAKASNDMIKLLLEMADPLKKVLTTVSGMLTDDVLPKITQFVNWIKNAYEKIMRFFDDPIGSLGNIFTNITKSIWEGVKDGVNYLVGLAVQIGKDIGTGFVNMLPDWLSSWLKKDQSEAERNLEQATTKLNALISAKADPKEIEAAKAEVDKYKRAVEVEKRNSPAGRQEASRESLQQGFQALTNQELQALDPKVRGLIDAEFKRDQAKKAGKDDVAASFDTRILRVKDLIAADVAKTQLDIIAAREKNDNNLVTKLEAKLKSLRIPGMVEVTSAVDQMHNSAITQQAAAENTEGTYVETAEITEKLLKELKVQGRTTTETTSEVVTANTENTDAIRSNTTSFKDWADSQDREDAELGEALRANTKETKENTSTVKAASTCELDYSSPQALFNSFAKIMIGGRPGATDQVAGVSTTAGQPSEAAVVTGPGGIVLPASGVATSLHGNRPDPFGSGRQQFHAGVDIAAPLGTDIVAPEGGTARVKQQVDRAGKLTGWGNYIEILDDQQKVIHRLAHLAESTIKDGEKVLAGQKIGKMGSTGSSTGSHLHWESFRNGQNIDPFKLMGINVAKGQTLSRTQLAQAAPATRPPGGTTPTGAQAVAATTPQAAVAGATTPNVPGAAAPVAGGGSPTSNLTSLMEDLNSNVKQLVTLTNQQLEISRKTLSATRGNSSDLMRSVT
jgi:murein DD-endopeptidase MepM/ murein hydrolase activator NlpD